MTSSIEAQLRRENEELRQQILQLGSTIARENDELRKLILQLTIIALRNVRESGALLRMVLERKQSLEPSNATLSPLPEEMSPGEMVLHLRDAAARCIQLSGVSANSNLGREFDSLSTELADVAERLETLFANPREKQQTIP